jgi:uncharacterized protein YcsI (UPF0317 family)
MDERRKDKGKLESQPDVYALSGDEIEQLRHAIRVGEFRGPTAGLAPGLAQANLVVLPLSYAQEFADFCVANPKPCPVLEITEPGDPVPRRLAPNADLRRDLPAYRVYADGVLQRERSDVIDLWRDDMVAFLLGCSFTFEHALLREGIGMRHIELGRNVPMYRTSVPCESVGHFSGPLVVSMRPIVEELVPKVISITSMYPHMHGGPVHVGDPGALGILDLSRPDYGDAVPVGRGEVPVFWACGVTPQAVAVNSRLPMMITHAPGCMFITERSNDEILAGAFDQRVAKAIG